MSDVIHTTRKELEDYYEEKRTRLERRQSLSTITASTADPKARTQNETLDQFQSPLFEKLPLEIRSRIWEYSLDFGEPLHITQGNHPRERRFRITDCERVWQEYVPEVEERPKHIEIRGPPTDNMPHGRCYHMYYPNYTYSNGVRMVDEDRGWEPLPTLSHEKWQPLSLLRSCRRIYTEAIDLLYSLNTFEFYLGLDVVHFASTIPTKRYSAITSITLYGDIGNVERGDRKEFKRVLSFLESCTRLEKVRVLIYAYLNDLMDRHSYWFTKKLATGRTFKKGVWLESIDSFSVRDPENWEEPVDEPNYGSDEETGDNDAQQGEKETMTRTLHYSRYRKFRVNEDGKHADAWATFERADSDLEYFDKYDPSISRGGESEDSDS